MHYKQQTGKPDRIEFRKWNLIFKFRSGIKKYLLIQCSQIGLTYSKSIKDKLNQRALRPSIFFLGNSKSFFKKQVFFFCLAVFIESFPPVC